MYIDPLIAKWTAEVDCIYVNLQTFYNNPTVTANHSDIIKSFEAEVEKLTKALGMLECLHRIKKQVDTNTNKKNNGEL